MCQLNNPEMIMSKVLLMMILKRMMMVIGLVIKDMVKRVRAEQGSVFTATRPMLNQPRLVTTLDIRNTTQPPDTGPSIC